MKVCPHCGAEALRVIYMGLPMNFCPDDECALLWGFWSDVAAWFPIMSNDEDGDPLGFKFMVYRGSYWRALWRWLVVGA